MSGLCRNGRHDVGAISSREIRQRIILLCGWHRHLKDNRPVDIKKNMWKTTHTKPFSLHVASSSAAPAPSCYCWRCTVRGLNCTCRQTVIVSCFDVSHTSFSFWSVEYIPQSTFLCTIAVFSGVPHGISLTRPTHSSISAREMWRSYFQRASEIRSTWTFINYSLLLRSTR